MPLQLTGLLWHNDLSRSGPQLTPWVMVSKRAQIKQQFLFLVLSGRSSRKKQIDKTSFETDGRTFAHVCVPTQHKHNQIEPGKPGKLHTRINCTASHTDDQVAVQSFTAAFLAVSCIY